MYYDAGEVSSLCRTVPKIKRFKTRLYSLYASSPFLKGLRFILRMLAAMLYMISGYVWSEQISKYMSLNVRRFDISQDKQWQRRHFDISDNLITV